MCVLFCVFSFTVSFCVLYVCKRVQYYCHRETTQLQLTNISMSILITIITTTIIIIIITAVPLSTHSSSFYYHLLVPLLHELDLQTNKQTNTYHSRSQHAISTDTNKHILVPFSLPTWRTTATSSPSPFLLFAHNYVTLSVSKRTIRQEGTSAAKHTKALVKPYEANKSPRWVGKGKPHKRPCLRERFVTRLQCCLTTSTHCGRHSGGRLNGTDERRAHLAGPLTATRHVPDILMSSQYGHTHTVTMSQWARRLPFRSSTTNSTMWRATDSATDTVRTACFGCKPMS